MMRPSDLVLTGFSGSLKSHVLLHLLHAGLSEKSHKRFLFQAQVLYIDGECNILFCQSYFILV